jgi:hypothetical protein
VQTSFDDPLLYFSSLNYLISYTGVSGAVGCGGCGSGVLGSSGFTGTGTGSIFLGLSFNTGYKSLINYPAFP